MAEFTCLLCTVGGQPTLAPQQGRLAICEDHYATLRATGRGWCHRGNHVAPASDLLANGRNLCRACDNRRRQERYRAHAEEEKAANRAYYYANYDQRRQTIKAWQRTNRPKMNAYKRGWCRRNRDKLAAYARIYRARNPERVRSLARLNSARRKLRILRGAA